MRANQLVNNPKLEEDVKKIQTEISKIAQTVNNLNGVGNSLSIKYPQPPRPATHFVDTGDRRVFGYCDRQNRVYSYDTSAFYYSEDEMETWVKFIDVPANITVTLARYLDNGSLLAVMYNPDLGGTSAKIYVTDNVADEEKVLEAKQELSGGYPTESWGFDSHGGLVFMSEYGNKYRPELQNKAYRSHDYGQTWEVIFEKYMEDGFHIHDIGYDPYDDTVWIVTGDTPSTNIYYSFDHGDTWKEFYGENSDVPINQRYKHTGVTATPTRILFATDMSPNGVHSIRKRTKIGGLPTYQHDDAELTYIIDDTPGISRVMHSFKEIEGAWYCTSLLLGDTTNRVLTLGSGDGVNFYELYVHEKLENESGKSTGFRNIFKAGDKIISSFNENGQHSAFVMDIPKWETLMQTVR